LCQINLARDSGTDRWQPGPGWLNLAVMRQRRSIITWLAIACCAGLSIPQLGAAQDLFLLAGGLRGSDPPSNTYSWSIFYSEPLTRRVSASISWLNEGHLPDHHRDGHVAQLWWRLNPDSRLALAAGAGLYRYFDTVVATNADHYQNGHGSGLLASLTATYPGSGMWLYQMRVQHAWTRESVDMSSLMLGLGYRLDQDRRTDIREAGRDYHAELVLLAGTTIVNSFSSERALASSIELRRRFGPVVRLSVAFVNEGDSRLIRRNGTIVEGWLEPSFFNGRLTLGAGAGSYIAIDRYHPQPDGRHISGIVTMSTSYHFTPRSLGRASWHRIVSDYDKDADIFLLGLGHNL
jgi:hypothetical protein